MAEALRRLGSRLARWFRDLPVGWKIGLGVAVTAGAILASWQSYEMYDYVQHDNEFCNSCHLMREPFERFAESGHRDLNCHECHQPTLVERSRMALTQIVEQPDTIGAHAEVPNQRCASCHIEGSPDEWRQIAGTAGHRVHLESEEPELEGLQCVECHSTSIHEFVPVSETCAQSGCHDDRDIALGEMAGMTELHCTVCHTFLRESEQRLALDTARAALTPREQDCRGCHAMDEVIEETGLAGEPHGAVCGKCHNPHEQERPAEAVESCAGSGCHERPDTLTSFHRGLDPGTLERCTDCHQAHTWEAPRSECLNCHQDIFQGDARPVETISAGGPRLGVLPGPGFRSPPPRGTQEGPLFSHRRHRAVSCTRCHGMEDEHGRLEVRTSDQCMGCHHSPEADVGCATCHADEEIGGRRAVPATIELSVREEAFSRDIPFEHAWHEGVECETCHTDAGGYASTRECASCHEEHHPADGEAECRICHEGIREDPHDRSVHQGCGGSGCHTDPVARPSTPTRSVCLTCHQDLVEHEAPTVCTECHAVPLGRQAPGGRR